MHDAQSSRPNTMMETKSRIDGPGEGLTMKEIQEQIFKEQEEQGD